MHVFSTVAQRLGSKTFPANCALGLTLAVILFSAPARATYLCNPGDSCVFQQFTGTISGGNNSGDGTNDDANLFNIGGGSTMGNTVTITLTYDLTSIQNNGAAYSDGVGYGYNFEDVSVDADYQLTVALNGLGTAFSVNPPSDGASYFYTQTDGSAEADNNDFFTYGVDNTLGTGLQFAIYSYDTTISPYDPTDITQIVQMLNDPSASIWLTGYTAFGQTASDSLQLTDVQATPEPGTWLSLVSGLAGLAFFQIRSHRNQR